MIEKFPGFHHFFTITNLSLTPKRRAKSLTPSFAKQCSLIDNGTALPSFFPLITEKSLSDVNLSIEDIKKIVSKLDSNKAHGEDMISICMLKLCDKTICKPLNIIFKSCLTRVC